jgi:hypothetical protein
MEYPNELEQIIASYVVPPIYRLADCFTNHIHWSGLCLNLHPGMIPLIDGYFERCLTDQSFLDYDMLYRLSINPTALPLLEKYQYHLLSRNISVDWKELRARQELFNPYELNPLNGSTLIRQEDYAIHPYVVEQIQNGSLSIGQLTHSQVDALYQNSAIFQIDSSATKAIQQKFIKHTLNIVH